MDDCINRKRLEERILAMPNIYQELLVPYDVLQVIRTEPAICVAQIVRCRDCEHGSSTGVEVKCYKHSSSEPPRFGEVAYSEYHSHDWFCADGKPREKK